MDGAGDTVAGREPIVYNSVALPPAPKYPFHMMPQSRFVSVEEPSIWMAPGGMWMVAVWALAAPGQQANAKLAVTTKTFDVIVRHIFIGCCIYVDVSWVKSVLEL